MARNIYGGGSKTNKNGLKFEQETSLETALANAGYTVIDGKVFIEKKQVALSASKHALYKKILEPNGIDYTKVISKQLLPDEALYVMHNKTIFIIEKKYQNVAGSVDEKLQTCDFKRKQYVKLFSPLGISVEYIYVFNDFFKNTSYRDVLKYIENSDCHYYFNEIPLDFLKLPQE